MQGNTNPSDITRPLRWSSYILQSGNLFSIFWVTKEGFEGTEKGVTQSKGTSPINLNNSVKEFFYSVPRSTC